MKGAREYARLFESGKYGRLYIESGSHARGKTFHIYVLSEGEEKPTEHSVEVYGIVSGHPGWTESYGWFRAGPWQKDFEILVIQREIELAERGRLRDIEEHDRLRSKQAQDDLVLSTYPVREDAK